ncbi:tetratricopeptide repeat-containing diguanylate cyclase [Parahaliea mediterranea]|uniref:tetratricopeptide repeat-containing diguanylate cyclase n=1 Tax=Parahaliea mediterranea TaxID=651086 RepID=UPI000E2EA083|nr:tetratricopeptide repeat-containing diguanylate cyclase [Parahaliea mediterranea]
MFRHIVCAVALLLCTATGWAVAPASASVDEEIAAQLRAMDMLVWKDPWAARARLQAMAPRIDGASNAVQARYYLRLAHALQYLYLNDEYDRAVAAGLAAADAHTAPRIRQFLQVLDAVRVRREGDYQGAAAQMQTVARQAQSAGDQFLYVFALVELGFTQGMGGRSEQAFPHLQEAFAAAVKLQDVFLIALVNEAYGAVYGYVNEYEQSIAHYRKALSSYADLGYSVYEAEATYGIGISYRYAGQWQRALEMFRRYRELTDAHHSEHGRFSALYGQGMTYAEMGDCDRALPVIAEALQAGAPEDFKAELYKRQAVCLARAGRAQEAAGAIAAAWDVFARLTEFTGTHWELEVGLAEAEVAAELGDMARAYTLLREYHEQIVALLRESASERLMTLRVEMENVRKDHEISLLQEEARIDALELEQQRRSNELQRLTLFFWIGVSAVVLFFLVWQVRNARQLREISSRDALTGLYNRRFIFHRLAALCAELPLDRGELSIVLVDVDDFKQVNDRYGHPAGDAILRDIATIGAALLRPGDELARVGGEEFLCLLPRTGERNAAMVAQRLLERVREHRFAVPGGGEVCITVSIGVASFSADCADADSLYAAADNAMYRAKSCGKDQLYGAG